MVTNQFAHESPMDPLSEPSLHQDLAESASGLHAKILQQRSLKNFSEIQESKRQQKFNAIVVQQMERRRKKDEPELPKFSTEATKLP